MLDNYPSTSSSHAFNLKPLHNSNGLNRSSYEVEAVHTAQMLNDYLVMAARKQQE